jgi:hypothetical protein
MEITMRAFKGTFKKKNGESRDMLFAKISDLPQSFLDSEVGHGAGSEQTYAEGMELVWDLEADNYRVFNWATIVSDPKELSIDEGKVTR